MEAITVAELVTCIKSSVEEGYFCFKLSELQHLYESHLKDFLASPKKSTRFITRNNFFGTFWRQNSEQWKNILLVFEKGMHQLWKQANSTSYKDDALIFLKLLKLCKNIWLYNSSGFPFNVTFGGNCQQDRVYANKSQTFTFHATKWSSIKDQNSPESQSCLTIPQSIMFKCIARPSKTSSDLRPHLI